MKNRLYQFAERLLLAVGVTLLVIVAAGLLHRWMSSRLALAKFDEAQAILTQNDSKTGVGAQAGKEVDFSLWSEKRVRAYRESLLIEKDAPLAVLRIDRLGIRVPVFAGTSDLILNRGLGWIAGTARPGETGDRNIGIAGHRDGFFRGLKDIAVADALELSTLGVVSLYTVDSFEIVTPDNVVTGDRLFGFHDGRILVPQDIRPEPASSVSL